MACGASQMNIISYSLFRSDQSAYESERAGAGRGVFFKGFLPTLVRAHRSVFPDWDLHIRHDERVTAWSYFQVLREMDSRRALRLFPMGESKTLCGSMMWRLYAAYEPGAEIVLCRDIDALPMPRGRRAVQRWIDSGVPFHSMQDSKSHRSARVMGGLVGLRVSRWLQLFPTRGDLINSIADSGIDMTKHGADQAFLMRALEHEDVTTDTPETLGDRLATGDPRDVCGGQAVHEGAAYQAWAVAGWYREFFPDPFVDECEAAAGWKPEPVVLPEWKG